LELFVGVQQQTAQAAHGFGIAAFRSAFEPVGRFTHIWLHTLPIAVQGTQLGLRCDITHTRSLNQQARRHRRIPMYQPPL
jgi:hypothetical protein